MKRLLLALSILLALSAGNAHAVFVSGSTGADGPFNPSANTQLQMPANGVFNFTTVNIPSGVTVTFLKNAANTPVCLLATGDVIISGIIKVDGGDVTYSSPLLPGDGGPGGYDGGYGGATNSPGGRGLGPGGGEGGPVSYYGFYSAGGGGGFGTAGGTPPYSPALGGSIYGNERLIPLIGGSGGGGRGGGPSNSGVAGGGGGGAILIASSTTITVNGSITANGGANYDYAGGGSGGAIRLIANTISGNGTISAAGGGAGYVPGGAGRIRLEASTINRSAGTDPVYSYGTPGSVFVANTPSLSVTSIAGVNVPAYPTGSYTQPDILLPNTTTNPVTVTLSASYIPVGTTVTVSVVPELGGATNVNTTLSGTLESSTGSANVNLSTVYPNVIMAQATFTLQAMYFDGEKIEKVRVATTMGKGSEAVYITASGKEIKSADLMAKLMDK